jgi:hypothetical protein
MEYVFGVFFCKYNQQILIVQVEQTDRLFDGFDLASSGIGQKIAVKQYSFQPVVRSVLVK